MPGEAVARHRTGRGTGSRARKASLGRDCTERWGSAAGLSACLHDALGAQDALTPEGPSAPAVVAGHANEGAVQQLRLSVACSPRRALMPVQPSNEDRVQTEPHRFQANHRTWWPGGVRLVGSARRGHWPLLVAGPLAGVAGRLIARWWRAWCGGSAQVRRGVTCLSVIVTPANINDTTMLSARAE
jgi:hypothetical protein